MRAASNDASELDRSRAEMPRGTTAILDRRDLANGHPLLAELLQPGMRVLDVGCGTGSITRCIAEIIGPSGEVLGVDTNKEFIERARVDHVLPGLSFAVADAYDLALEERFDLVTAARLLQWLARPLDALRSLVKAVKPGGQVVILDYNHQRITWHPQPPGDAVRFYDAFLRWRAEAGFDNAIADHLDDLFERVRLSEVTAKRADEISTAGQAGLTIWADVAATRGHQMVADGMLSEVQRSAAEAAWRTWAKDSAERQTLYLVSCSGRRPNRA